jgi:predicted SnoaL-like aldol condensation-catalyzing enzyme
METKSNKTIVLECYRKIIRDLDLLQVDDYISDNYIQHSPTVKNGKAGLLEMLNYLKMMPRPAEKSLSPILRVIADGDLVAAHLEVKFMGKKMAVIDIFRVADGKLAEHWDAGQVIPDEANSAITMTNGSTALNETINASESKAIINNFYNNVVLTGKFEQAGECFTPGYINHYPADDIFNKPGCNYKVHRIIAQGDFVVVQCECENTAKTFAIYSIFRIEGDKIAEHWAVEQEVPDLMAHANGMF